MRKALKLFLLGFIILIVLGAAQSGRTKPEKVADGSKNEIVASEPPKIKTEVFKIGDTVKLDGKVIVVNSVKPYKNRNQFMDPKEGNGFIAVDVTLKNDSSEAYNYNVLEFKLQDNQDYSYTNALSDIEPTLSYGTIQPGQTTRGFIVFEIPTSNSAVKLIYTPSFWGTQQILIDLS